MTKEIFLGESVQEFEGLMPKAIDKLGGIGADTEYAQASSPLNCGFNEISLNGEIDQMEVVDVTALAEEDPE